MKRVLAFASALALAVGAIAPAAFADDLPVEYPDGNYDLDTVIDDPNLNSLFLSQLGLYGASSSLGTTFDWFERKYIEMMVAGIVGTGAAAFNDIVDQTIAYIHQESLPLPLTLSGHTFHLSYKPEIEDFIRNTAYGLFLDYSATPREGVYFWGKNFISFPLNGQANGRACYSVCYFSNTSSSGYAPNASRNYLVDGWLLRYGSSNAVICTYAERDASFPYMMYYITSGWNTLYGGSSVQAYTNISGHNYGYITTVDSSVQSYLANSGMPVYYTTASEAVEAFYSAEQITGDTPNGEGYVFPLSVNLDFGGFFADNQSISNYYYTTYGDQITTGDVNYNQYITNWSIYNISYSADIPYWLVYSNSVPLEFNYELELPTADLYELPSEFYGGDTVWDDSFNMLGGFGAFILLGFSFGLVSLFFKD